MGEGPVNIKQGGTVKKKPNRPGPGSHDIPMFPENSPIVPSAAAFTMASGREEKGGKKTRAGPGAYYPRLQLSRPTERCYGFSRTRRFGEEPAVKVDGPAPKLEQGDNAKFNRAPGHGFGTEEKFFKTPGASSDYVPRGMKMPGPGEHNPDDHATSNAHVTNAVKWAKPPPLDQKNVIKMSNVPGPGEHKAQQSYDTVCEKTTPKFGFGTTARLMGAHRKSYSPGPGAYSTMNTTRTGHSCVGGSAPRWSMASRPEIDLSAV